MLALKTHNFNERFKLKYQNLGICTFLGFRGQQEYHQMEWGDIYYDSGEDCLKFNERQTKTRTGSLSEVRSLQPKAFRNTADPARCPVALFLEFESRRPDAMLAKGSPFFLAIKHNRLACDPIWYKSQAMGEKTIAVFMKSMATKAGIPGRKTNHSVRKMMTSSLLHAGYAPTHIKALTGHKNEASIANYAVPSKQQHREMCDVLMNNRSAEDVRSASGLPLVTTKYNCHSKPEPAATVSKIPECSKENIFPIPNVASENKRPHLNDVVQGVFYGADCRNQVVNLYVNTGMIPNAASSSPVKPPKKRRYVIYDSDSSEE